jgi:serine/threonine protein kinase
MALASGTKLGQYEIQSPLGAGGMGKVYRARDSRLNRDVAVKILSSTFARDPERLRRFQQEAQAVAALNHPNILAVHDVGQYDGSLYMVTELLEARRYGSAFDRVRCRPARRPNMLSTSRVVWLRHTIKASFTAT